MLRTAFHGLVLGVALVLLVARAGNAAPDAPASDAVDIKVLKYKDLCSAIRAQRGKVVVVDIWGEF
jgi:hypothetical protein